MVQSGKMVTQDLKLCSAFHSKNNIMVKTEWLCNFQHFFNVFNNFHLRWISMYFGCINSTVPTFVKFYDPLLWDQ